MRYPVITVLQCYAALLTLGIKDVENRTYPLPQKLLGQTILIHAGAQWHAHYKNRHDALKKVQEMIIHAACRSHYSAYEVASMISSASHVVERGGIVGAMRITKYLALPDGFSAECVKSAWAIPGHVHWFVEDARPVPWYPCKGKQGIWYLNYPHEVPEMVA